MTGILTPHTVETPKGEFIVYPGSTAKDAESHKPLYWYYAPKGWEGPPYSEAFYSSAAAEEALWESLRPRP
ncbi:MAG: hypothetical protein RDU20_03480 [Desulfomonilaceae bacterium]|nr:hypothetical protein [Desulfomonilaceae bacterium]